VIVYNKKSLLLTITIAILLLTQVTLSNQSFAQIQNNPNESVNNTAFTITPSSKDISQNPALLNKSLFNPDIYHSFLDNFTSANSSDIWYNVSGLWAYSERGLQAGTMDNTTSQVNNRYIAPVAAQVPFSVNSSFTIDSLNEDVISDVVIIYDMADLQNYQQAGITIYKDDIYLRFADVKNGSLSSTSPGIGVETDLDYEPGFLFNMSLSVDDEQQQLTLNGKSHSRDIDSTILDGYVGLKYGRIMDMTFHDFKLLPEVIYKANVSNEYINKENNSANDTIVSDSQTILLEDISLPEGNYIHLYDSTPYQIMEGNIAAKLPCNDDSSTDVKVLLGQAPNLQATGLELSDGLSVVGDLCMYDVNIGSSESNPITDIAIQNNSTDDIDFLPTSSIIIDIKEIKKLS
jgi:hypothetical protein